MKLQHKVLVYVALIVGISSATIFIYQYIASKKTKLYDAETVKSQQFTINYALKTNSEIFTKFVNDYSGWDDMVSFVTKPDSTWYNNNVDVLISSINISLSLIYNKEQNIVYKSYDTLHIKKPLVLDKTIIKTAFVYSPYCHFYHYFGNELYEIFGGVIVPSSDFLKRATSPAGYLIMGRLCNAQYLKSLESATSFNAKINRISEIPTDSATQKSTNYYHQHNLPNYQNQPIASISFSKPNEVNQNIGLLSNYSLFVGLIALFILISIFFVLNKIVIEPITAITDALSKNSTTPITPLILGTNEFNKIAKMISEFFLQKEILKESNAILYLAIEQSPVSLVVTNFEGKIEYVNPAFTRSSGYEWHEAVGNSFDFLMAEQMSQETLKAVNSTVRAGETWSGEIINQTKNGEIYYNESIITPFKGVNGEFSNFVAINNNITLRKKAEELKKITDANLDALINNRDEAFWSIDTNYNFITYNKFFKDDCFAAFNIELKKGLNALSILPPELVEFWKPKYDIALTGQRVVFEITNQVESTIRYYKVSLNPIIADNEVTGVSGLSVDITEQEDALEKLKKLIATRDKLFSIIAHDLRSPFTCILGITDLLIKNIQTYNLAQTEEYLGIVNSSAKRTFILLDNLLNWAKTQTGNIYYKPEEVSLTSTIYESIEVAKPIATIKKIAIIYNPSEEVNVFADQNMLKTVLLNLITNAIKFTFPDGYIEICSLQNHTFMEITISDNGVGMSQETQDKLFDIDTNNTTYGTANEKGSGLGLIICKDFVEKQGGKIWVESVVNKGTKFKFTIPLLNKN